MINRLISLFIAMVVVIEACECHRYCQMILFESFGQFNNIYLFVIVSNIIDLSNKKPIWFSPLKVPLDLNYSFRDDNMRHVYYFLWNIIIKWLRIYECWPNNLLKTWFCNILSTSSFIILTYLYELAKICHSLATILTYRVWIFVVC